MRLTKQSFNDVIMDNKVSFWLNIPDSHESLASTLQTMAEVKIHRAIGAGEASGELQIAISDAVTPGQIEKTLIRGFWEITLHDKRYVVKIDIQAGEYDKSTVALVLAANPDEAKSIAIRDEAHNELYPLNGYLFENDDSFAYRAHSVTEVSAEEYEILKKFL